MRRYDIDKMENDGDTSSSASAPVDASSPLLGEGRGAGEGAGEGAAGPQVSTGRQAADEHQSDFEKQMKSALNANTKGCCGGQIKSPTTLIESALSEYARKEIENSEVLPTNAAQFSQEDKDKMRLSRQTKSRLIEAAAKEISDAEKKDKPAKSLERAMISVWTKQPELHPFTSHGFSSSQFKDNKSLKCVAAMQFLTTIKLKKRSALERDEVDMKPIALYALETLLTCSQLISVMSEEICPEARTHFTSNIKVVTENLLDQLFKCQYNRAIINILGPEVNSEQVYKPAVQIYLHIKSMCNTHRVEPYCSVEADTNLFHAKKTADKSKKEVVAKQEQERVLSHINTITNDVRRILSQNEGIGAFHSQIGAFLQSDIYKNSATLLTQHQRLIAETSKLMGFLITLEPDHTKISDSDVNEITAMNKTSLQKLVHARITAAAEKGAQGRASQGSDPTMFAKARQARAPADGAGEGEGEESDPHKDEESENKSGQNESGQCVVM